MFFKKNDARDPVEVIKYITKAKGLEKAL